MATDEASSKREPFLAPLSYLQSIFQQNRAGGKTHDFTGDQPGIDYVFELQDSPAQGYMTSCARAIRRGDYILLQDEEGIHCYHVEKVEYYADPAEMWVALLRKTRYGCGLNQPKT